MRWKEIIFLLLFSPLNALGMIPGSFDVEVQLDHCPEHKIRPSLELEIFYSVGSNPNLLAADVISIVYDDPNNTATAVLRFPTNMGSTPFNIQARCKDPSAFSAQSNVLSVSNCNFISTLDTDKDGIKNNLEDTNCDNLFTTSDYSNLENVDTDGDGARDIVEAFAGTNPKNPGSSMVPLVFSSNAFDPDLNGESNPIVWRSNLGNFYIKDAGGIGNNLSIRIGRNGDTPITYQPKNAPPNVGVIRIESNNTLNWYLKGPGFKFNNGTSETSFSLGLAADNLVFGPYETPGVTNPAIARLFNSTWTFLIKLADGNFRYQPWGVNGDIPKPQDYDGDGIFDIAVYRPSTHQTFIISSINQTISTIEFGTSSSDLSVRGDYTGDGKADIAFWEPITGMFYTLKSDLGFNTTLAAIYDPLYYEQLQLGVYFVHTPLNWNRRAGRFLYTVSDRSNGYRYYRPANTPNAGVAYEQWGIGGDHLG